MNSQKIEPTIANIDNESMQAFLRMKRIATALFFAMVLVFVVAKTFENQFPPISYLRAFGEAAMVGALADWFAGTALFRRPMGLPIPHTAIIPRSKNRIGDGLGRFISRNFLQPQQVELRLEKVELATGFANWINTDDRAQKLAEGLAATVPRALGLLKDGPISDWLQQTIKTRIQNTDIATVFADGLALLTRNKRHKPIVDLIIFHSDLLVHSHEAEFREKVSQNVDWLPKLLAVDNSAADALLDAIKETLHDAANNPNHTIRDRIDDALNHLQHSLRFDPNMRMDLANWIKDLAEHETITKYISSIWDEIKRELGETNPQSQAKLANAIANILREVAAALIENQELNDSLNQKLKQWAIDISSTQGEAVGEMVSETIKSWDASTVVSQIENAVGRDLQFIRINGTIIGGLVGLMIHTISEFALR